MEGGLTVPIAVTLALFAWPVVVLGLFLAMRPAKAAFVAFVVGWLYLPLASIDVVGLPPYGKFTATSMAVALCVVVFDGGRAWKVRPTWLDLPMLVWLLVPIPSSLSNDLGLWDGFSGVSDHLLRYGVPYFVGRMYLTSERNFALLGNVIVLGAVTYLPLCLWEMRMSPQLHGYVYGIRGRANWQYRDAFGLFGWQPNVFMNSAFEVTMLMMMAAMVTFWGWRTGRLRHVKGVDIRVLVGVFVVFAVLCKKWSGIGLMTMGLVTLGITERIRRPIWLYLVLLAPMVYMVVFSLNIYRGEGLSDVVANFSDQRAHNLQFRIDNDSLLIDKAMERPLFGWGRHGRMRIYNERGQDVSITDSAYGIHLGTMGAVGLAAVTLLYALPVAAFVRRYPPVTWQRPPAAMVVPFALIAGLHLIDNLFNAFPNAMYPMFAGGVAAVASQHSVARLGTNLKTPRVKVV